MAYNTALNIFATEGPSLELSRYINTLKHQIRTEYQILQNSVWNNIINKLEIEDDPKIFWKTIRKLQGNNKSNAPYIRDHHNNKIDEPKEKEALFRNHWQNIFTDQDPEENNFDTEFTLGIERRVENRKHDLNPHDYSRLDRLSPACPPITLTELKNTISSFKQKAPGPTGITLEHIKRLPSNMIEALRNIFNHSLAAGYYPTAFKTANMIFIPKGNQSQHQITNYRPISLIDVQAKILDKILKNRLVKHLDTHNLHNIRQHGFRKNRGTHTALAIFNESIASAKAQNQLTDIVLRDVSKAFDKVWHTGLKYKL